MSSNSISSSELDAKLSEVKPTLLFQDWVTNRIKGLGLEALMKERDILILERPFMAKEIFSRIKKEKVIMFRKEVKALMDAEKKNKYSYDKDRCQNIKDGNTFDLPYFFLDLCERYRASPFKPSNSNHVHEIKIYKLSVYMRSWKPPNCQCSKYGYY